MHVKQPASANRCTKFQMLNFILKSYAYNGDVLQQNVKI